MTPEQLSALKLAINAETAPAFVALRQANETGQMAAWFNAPSTFVAGSKAVPTGAIGKAINYVAFAAMTTANRGTLTAFLDLNPSTFDGSKPDVREMLAGDTAAGIFSGALGGQGAATRAALLAIMVRLATRGERVFATGTGTSIAPGVLEFEGQISNSDVLQALAS